MAVIRTYASKERRLNEAVKFYELFHRTLHKFSNTI